MKGKKSPRETYDGISPERQSCVHRVDSERGKQGRVIWNGGGKGLRPSSAPSPPPCWQHGRTPITWSHGRTPFNRTWTQPVTDARIQGDEIDNPEAFRFHTKTGQDNRMVNGKRGKPRKLSTELKGHIVH